MKRFCGCGGKNRVTVKALVPNYAFEESQASKVMTWVKSKVRLNDAGDGCHSKIYAVGGSQCSDNAFI